MLNILKKIFVSSLLLLSVNAYSQTQVMNGEDDATVHINLGHNFPYYGGVFTDAWMSSNGFIILYDPTIGYGNSNTGQSWCNTCPWGYSGGPPQGKSNLSYMIAPMWSDFRHHPSVENSGYFYETGEGGTWFEWRNVQEYGTNNLNTFGLQLWPEGSFDFHYANVNVTQHDTWIGFTGDATSQSGNVYNEVNELFYKQASEGGMTTNHVTNFTDAETNFGYAWWGQDGGYDSTGPDCSDPLNDTSCPGYQQAYHDQQCSSNPLYDTSCSGYQQAYTNQQCANDPLYNSSCAGYADAYFDQQCTDDALYDSGCAGYADAYYDQQCTDDALYDSQCDGYANAWLDDQCESDPLFADSCAGYAAARIQDDQTNENQFFDGQDDMGYSDDQDYMGGQGPSDGPSDDGEPPQDGSYNQPNDQDFGDPMSGDSFAMESNSDGGIDMPDDPYDPEPPEQTSFHGIPEQPFNNDPTVAAPEPEYQQPLEPVVQAEIHYSDPEPVEIENIDSIKKIPPNNNTKPSANIFCFLFKLIFVLRNLIQYAHPNMNKTSNVSPLLPIEAVTNANNRRYISNIFKEYLAW